MVGGETLEAGASAAVTASADLWITALLGIAVSLVASLLKTDGWSARVKTLLVAGLSIGAAYLSALLQSATIAGQEVWAHTATAAAVAVGSYEAVLKDTVSNLLEEQELPVIGPILGKIGLSLSGKVST